MSYQYSIMSQEELLTVVLERDAEWRKNLKELLKADAEIDRLQKEALNMRPIIDAARDLMETDHPDHYFRLEEALAAYDRSKEQ